MQKPQISVVIPVHNEATNIQSLYASLVPVLEEHTAGSYEIVYVDDGSTDKTNSVVAALHDTNPHVVLVGLSKNFGKEIALAAGIAATRGEAIILMDGDGQHPVEAIPEFIGKWHNGWQVVVGVRLSNQSEGFVKKYGSWLFYTLFNRFSGIRMVPGSSDFRLIDRAVADAFMQLHEPQSITRGLIDWLGFERTYVSYNAHARAAGQASYRLGKLFKLAADSFISLSPKPLYAFGYLGLLITTVSFVVGITVAIEQILLHDPLNWGFTGTAMLSILVLFLVGLLLVAQGVLALYVSYIYTQSKGRPLYIINPKRSGGTSRH